MSYDLDDDDTDMNDEDIDLARDALLAELPDMRQILSIGPREKRALNEALYTASERNMFPDTEGSISIEDALFVHALVEWALTKPDDAVLFTIIM